MVRWVVALIVLLEVGWIGPARAQEVHAVEVVGDIPYVEGETFDPERHILDLYTPQSLDAYPVLLFVHGGAWVSGSKAAVANVGWAFAARGIGVAAINYRLSPQVTHPAHIQDVARAFAWVVEHVAEYGGDPARMVVAGHSAGGHLVSMLALNKRYLRAVGHAAEEITGVLAISGVFWIDDWIMEWATGAFPETQQARDAASPVKLVREGAPPFLLLVSQQDYPQLVVETGVMQVALEGVGVPVTMHQIARRDHYSIVSSLGSDGDEATQIIFDWLVATFNGIGPKSPAHSN